MNVFLPRPGLGPLRRLPRAAAHRWPALAVAAVVVAIPTGVALANSPQNFPDGITTSFLAITPGPGTGTGLSIQDSSNNTSEVIEARGGGLTAVFADSTNIGVEAGGGQTGIHAVGVNGFGVDASGPTAVRAQGFGGTAVDAEGGIGGTAIKATSSSSTPAVVVSNTTGDGIDATGTEGAGVSGTATGQNAAIGVFGTGKGPFGIGVAGNGDDVGVAGNGINVGVRGHGVNGVGVSGDSVSGLGGEFRGATAPLRLDPAATAGAPTTGTHHKGELYVDSKGQLFLCIADSTGGNAGTWKQVVLK